MCVSVKSIDLRHCTANNDNKGILFYSVLFLFALFTDNGAL